MHELVCRGVSGISLKVDQDPSPRDPASVTMALRYKPATKPTGPDVRLLEPGTCTWNPLGASGVKPEPGIVRFDVRREAQPWSLNTTRMLDTTAGAARFFPDPITLPRYLADPRHYWGFFVDDVTNYSHSFGSKYDPGSPTYVTINGPMVLANDARRDLLCRGGPSGLLFGGGTNAGANLSKVIVNYRVSGSVPGPRGSGLSPGTCAWTDRTAMPKEPGRVAFITASNAQLKQAQSGSVVDRSSTAAERWPDVNTIPEYLRDPAHFWRFTAVAADPDSALTHGAWKVELTNVVATTRTAPGATTPSMPGTSAGNAPFDPARAGTSNVTSLFDIRNVNVTPGLEGVALRFDAAPDIKPTVTLTPAGGSAPITAVVGGAPNGRMWRYSAASPAKLARNAQYTFRIDAPATASARANSKSGTFRTLSQRATISVSQIYLISDGDKDGDGEVLFTFDVCPRAIEGFYLAGPEGSSLTWGDGPHRTYVELKSSAEVPDRFQLWVMGVEDDRVTVSLSNSRNWPMPSCKTPLPAPGRNIDYEWNSLAIDFDLSKYPGAKAGDSFVRRTPLPASGGSLMFEVRGCFQVTRH
jgi:hypothetical protein